MVWQEVCLVFELEIRGDDGVLGENYETNPKTVTETHFMGVAHVNFCP